MWIKKEKRFMHRIKMTPLAGALSIAGLLSITPVMAQTGTPVVKKEMIYDGSNPSMLHADPIDGGKHSSLFAKDPAGNIVTVKASGSNPVYRVYGGVNASAKTTQDITDNTVNVSAGTIEKDVYGGYSAKGQVKNNTVAIGSDNSSDIRGEVNGGRAIQGDAINNKVNVTGALATVGYGDAHASGVTGAASDNGNVLNNTVTIRGSAIAGEVNGGRVFKKGDAKDNQVNITGGTVNGDVVGAVSAEGSVSGNTTTIVGGDHGSGDVEGGVSGGRVTRGNATGNKVDISGGTIHKGVDGAFSGNGKVSENVVTIRGGRIGGEVHGGGTAKGDATENKVTIASGTIDQDVAGAYSNDGNVFKNTVTIRGGEIASAVMGGQAIKGNATENTVDVSGVQLQSNTITGGYSVVGNVSKNTVKIDHSKLSGRVYGGHSYQNATENRVDISHSAIGDNVEGGDVLGSGLTVRSASNNIVNISDSSIEKNVYGGRVRGAGSSSHNQASNNTVNLGKATVSGDVYGGDAGQAGVSSNNTINLIDTTVKGVIHGGTSAKDTGNTLNVIHHSQVKGITDIQKLNFSLPADIKNGETVLGISGDAVDLKHTDVKVANLQGASHLHVGDVVTLVDKTKGQAASVSATHVKQGTAVEYDFKPTNDAYKLQLQLIDKLASRQTTVLSQSQIAGLALVNQGADRVSALSSELSQGVEGVQLFGDIGGSSSRYNSANVKLTGETLVTGVAQRATDKLGRRLLGAFFEYGTGSYNTQNDAGSEVDANGSGNTHYTGVGLFARYDLSSGLYVNSALRVGRASLNFNTDWLDGKQPISVNQSQSTPYYGAQLGVGWTYALSEKMALDLSSQLLWSHVNGSTQDIAGNSYHFNALDSQRWHNGVRLNYAFNPNLTTYGGVAYEQEFAAKAAGTVNVAGDTLNLAEQSIKGGTAIAEWGIHWTQTKANGQGFNFDAGLQGYTGKRKGFGEQLHVSYVF